MDLQVVLLDGVDWNHLALVRDRWRALLHAITDSTKCRQYLSGTTLLQGVSKSVSQSVDVNVEVQSSLCIP
jgi:hypothetical protein